MVAKTNVVFFICETINFCLLRQLSSFFKISNRNCYLLQQWHFKSRALFRAYNYKQVRIVTVIFACSNTKDKVSCCHDLKRIFEKKTKCWAVKNKAVADTSDMNFFKSVKCHTKWSINFLSVLTALAQKCSWEVKFSYEFMKRSRNFLHPFNGKYWID